MKNRSHRPQPEPQRAPLTLRLEVYGRLFAVTEGPVHACLRERPRVLDAMSAEKDREPLSNEVSPHETEVDPQFSACADEGALRGFPETQPPDRPQGAI